MKPVGTMELETREDGLHWKVTAPPHIMIKLKAVFPRLCKGQFGSVFVKNSNEVCADLQWFCQRYHFEVKHKTELAQGAEDYYINLDHLGNVLLPDFKRNYDSDAWTLALPPRHYQEVAAEIFIRSKALLLTDQLGLGKSVTALDVLAKPKFRPALIVVPTHLQVQWENYIKKFLPKATSHIIKTGKFYELPSVDFYIITYSKLAGWTENLAKFIRCCIFDEIQELRHTDSQKYQAAKHLQDAVQCGMGLSATPIYNYGGEIFNVCEVIKPGHLGTRAEFEREWCSTRNAKVILKDSKAFGQYLRESFFMVGRTRTEVGMELPAVTTVIETIEYDASVLDRLDSDATELALRLLRKETTFHEKGEAAREFDMRLRQATGIAKAPFVADFVEMLVALDEPVILAGWHRAVYDVWTEKFLRKNLPYSIYTGTENPKRKLEEVEKFLAGETKIFILSNRSGVGLDGLQNVCSTVVHGELDWSGAIHDQICGRLNRDGQLKAVMQYFLVSDAGSDPVVADILGIKNAQIQGLLGRDGFELKPSEVTNRVTRLAQEYLKRRSIAIPALTM